MVWIEGIKAVAAALGFGAIEFAGVDLLYLGSPNSLSDAEGHYFSSPVSNLTSHIFSPLASNIVPSSRCLFCL
jgi:trimethylamine:corrinoid methyltransferase-like protein